MTIDAVITWVDGNDPLLNAKRQKYGTKKQFSQIDVAGATRFANVGEIFWCVASINRFAPWIRRIFIITDGQDPHLEPFLEKHFPEGYIPIEIVDHKVIFEGYEQYLPTFNSISIETMIWRIPGLSERFIYFNDDLMLTEPAKPEDFFTPNGIVSYVGWRTIIGTRIRYAFKAKQGGKKRMSNKWTMYLAARLLGEKYIFMKLYHTPRGLLRSYFEQFYAEHEDLLIRNIRHKFRDPEQYSVMELQYMGLFRLGRNEKRSTCHHAFYLFPKKKPNYVLKKMRKLERGHYKCCCFNSLDLATPEDRKRIENWITIKLGL